MSQPGPALRRSMPIFSLRNVNRWLFSLSKTSIIMAAIWQALLLRRSLVMAAMLTSRVLIMGVRLSGQSPFCRVLSHEASYPAGRLAAERLSLGMGQADIMQRPGFSLLKAINKIFN